MKVLLKILIADDQTLFADMLKTIIQTYEGFEVVACAKNGEEAFDKFSSLHPDVCILDIQMPITDGIYALKKIKNANPEAKIIMLTTFSDDENILNAYINDADGYLLKDILPEALINAIKSVNSGLSVMNKGIQKFLAENLEKQKSIHSAESALLSNIVLNERDVEIIRLIAKGLSNKLIAEDLNYSEGTVRNRISQILMSTGLSDRTQLALFGIKNRLV